MLLKPSVYDFGEKECAVVGGLKSSHGPRYGPREGAVFVAASLSGAVSLRGGRRPGR